MSILVACPECGRYFSRKKVTCSTPECGASLARSNKFKVNVKKPNGRRITRTVKGKLAIAKQVESKLMGDIAQQKHLGIVKAPGVSFVWGKYIAWAEHNKKGWIGDKQRYESHIESVIGFKKMDEVTGHDVQKIISAMQLKKTPHGKDYAPQTIKHVHSLVKRLYNWAREMEFYEGENPALRVKPPKVQNERTECLTQDELKNLGVVLDNWWNKGAARIVRFALLTGMRRGEILGLRWEDVNLRKGFVTLHDPKGQPAVLPLNKAALKVLEDIRDECRHDNCEWVFPNKWGNKRTSFNKIWNNIRKNAGIPDGFRFHGLRHTYASYLASSGEVDLYTLQKLLNHQSPQMTQRYAHLLDEALRKGAEVAGEIFVK